MVAVISKIVFSSIAIVTTSILSAIPIHSLTSLARKFWAFGSVWCCPSISYTESTLNKDHTGCWSFACSPPFFLKICPVLIQASEIANNDAYIPQISRALPSGSLGHCFISVFPVHVFFCSRVLTQIFWEPIRIEIKTTNALHHGKFGTSVSWWCVVDSLSSGFSVLKIRPISSNNSEGFWKHGV